MEEEEGEEEKGWRGGRQKEMQTDKEECECDEDLRQTDSNKQTAA